MANSYKKVHLITAIEILFRDRGSLLQRLFRTSFLHIIIFGISSTEVQSEKALTSSFMPNRFGSPTPSRSTKPSSPSDSADWYHF